MNASAIDNQPIQATPQKVANNHRKPFLAAVDCQDVIQNTLKRQDLPASAVVALSEQWLKLEQFKRSIRPKSGPAKRSKDAAGSRDTPEPGQSAMREPDEPPAAE